MRALLTLLLALGCLQGAWAQVQVDGDWEGTSLRLRVRVPFERLADFDGDGDHRLTLLELQARRAALRERLLMLLAVRAGGVTLRPGLETWEAGDTPTEVGLLLTYTLPPKTSEVNLRAGLGSGERCVGRLRGEGFVLTSERPQWTFRRFDQPDYMLAFGMRHSFTQVLLLLCLLLPARSWRGVARVLIAYGVAHALGALWPGRSFPPFDVVAAAGLNLARPAWELRWPLALVCGFLHGREFAGQLGGQFLPLTLVGFEMGQVLVACLAWPLLRKVKGRAVNVLILLLALILGFALPARADVFVDGEWTGRAFSLRLDLPLSEFDDDKDGQLSLREVQSHRAQVRERLAGVLQVHSSGKVLRPSLQPRDSGLLLIYGIPPRCAVTLQAGNTICRGKIGDEPFVLLPGERREICRGEALETLLAIALLLLCPLLPALLWLRSSKEDAQSSD